MSTTERIPFKVDISRVIEVLAKQIYQSPLALLRENTQNSYDAILLRHAKDPAFDPKIEVEITPTSVTVIDNGIGMTRDELKNNFWQAGSSSKNTDEARAAGVVGTFGIGAMANFGIAESLTVETEGVGASERIRCQANRSTLSATEECISFDLLPATGVFGTRVTATLLHGKTINVQEAIGYISEFVMFLPISVIVNGEERSRQAYTVAVPELPVQWEYSPGQIDLGRGFSGIVRITGAANGEVRIEASGLSAGGSPLPGRLLLRQGLGSLRTFRSGFGLATTTVHSVYGLGGVADFLFLQPTAGREALSTQSMSVLQEVVSVVDDVISLQISTKLESDLSNAFMSWVCQKGRYELCGRLKMQCVPGVPTLLSEIRDNPQKPWLVYPGNDQSTLSHATEDRPLLVFSRSNPRRQCEQEFLRRHCEVEIMSDAPQVQKEIPVGNWTVAQQGLAFRLNYILSADYFVAAEIRYGVISHNLPVLALFDKNQLSIWLDPNGGTVSLILSLHSKEYLAFDSMAKDFVRTIIFPRIADHVPSSTRQGAEAFLKTVQRTRETFEYEAGDLDSLQSIWSDYAEGKLSMTEAADRSATISAKAVQFIESSAASTVREVVPDVIENAVSLAQETNSDLQADVKEARPPIQRLEVPTDCKLLTIPASDPALNGYRCFLAISDRVREDRGDFFLQPHKTSVVWGGQRALFVFEHHSGKFGLYYDVQGQEMIGEASGGGSYITSTLVLKNRIFIPVPPEIEAAFIPDAQEKKRLQIKCDLLFIN
jgi:molecular chaperone HtpG